jgi:hypothetical protein
LGCNLYIVLNLSLLNAFDLRVGTRVKDMEEDEGKDVGRMWEGCGKDVGRMWEGCGKGEREG